jgi:hypothetical protein
MAPESRIGPQRPEPDLAKPLCVTGSKSLDLHGWLDAMVLIRVEYQPVPNLPRLKL